MQKLSCHKYPNRYSPFALANTQSSLLLSLTLTSFRLAPCTLFPLGQIICASNTKNSNQAQVKQTGDAHANVELRAVFQSWEPASPWSLLRCGGEWSIASASSSKAARSCDSPLAYFQLTTTTSTCLTEAVTEDINNNKGATALLPLEVLVEEGTVLHLLDTDKGLPLAAVQEGSKLGTSHPLYLPSPAL